MFQAHDNCSALAIRQEGSNTTSSKVQSNDIFLPWMLGQTGHEQSEEQYNFSQHLNHLTEPAAHSKITNVS